MRRWGEIPPKPTPTAGWRILRTVRSGRAVEDMERLDGGRVRCRVDSQLLVTAMWVLLDTG